jgi:hypothetical protein
VSATAASGTAWRRATAIGMVALVNAAAVVPVWLGVWSVFALVGLYWFENLSLGVIQFLKMRRVEQHQRRREGVGMSGFFAMHYGIFTAVHGVLVLVFFGFLLEGAHSGGAAAWWLSALLVAAVPALAYYRDYVRGEAARRASLDRLMLEPYARVLALHLVVLGGAWFALTTEQPRAVLLLLAGLKLIVELGTAWGREAAGTR